ncbi:MAG: hypothetical protein PVH12_07285 [Candidatus Bathyarchaeota archaeon]|jgi:5-methyltetrahydropteroyltriglutamate--homocysteine methyltransferase
MNVLVDDVGSFPLPSGTNRRIFEKAYVLARKRIIKRKDIKNNDFLLENFHRVIVDSFIKKCDSGLDVVNYPQHYDMHKQFIDIIRKAMDKGTYVVDERDAIIPEVHVIKEEAKRFYERKGNKVLLRVCITGPMELYLSEIGTTPYKDVLFMFAENIKHFAQKAMLNSKYIKTEVIVVDEPSFGFQDIDAEKDLLIEVLEKALDFNSVQKHIHLHSPSRVQDVLDVKNLDVLSFEYAASPQNIKGVLKSDLERADKQIRVGISRTDINSIISELYDKGISKPKNEQLIDSEEVIKRRFHTAKKIFGETMTFAGPDCGLGGWPTQRIAQLLLKRTVDVVRSADI